MDLFKDVATCSVFQYRDNWYYKINNTQAVRVKRKGSGWQAIAGEGAVRTFHYYDNIANVEIAQELAPCAN